MLIKGKTPDVVVSEFRSKCAEILEKNNNKK